MKQNIDSCRNRRNHVWIWEILWKQMKSMYLKKGSANLVEPFIYLRGQVLAFFDHLLPSIDISYLMNVDKKSKILDYLPPSSCKRSLWTTHEYSNFQMCKIFYRHHYSPEKFYRSVNFESKFPCSHLNQKTNEIIFWFLP
jgi:hypothetical protein